MLIEKHLTVFLNNDYEHVGMNICKNNQIILQVYESKNVKRWGVNMFIPDAKGIILDLTFNKQKNKNKENYNRLFTT